MNSEPHKTITLDFIRDDGKHQITNLFYYSLNEARNMADSVFRNAQVRYTEVEIRVDNEYSEILANLYPATVEDLQRI